MLCFGVFSYHGGGRGILFIMRRISEMLNRRMRERYEITPEEFADLFAPVMASCTRRINVSITVPQNTTPGELENVRQKSFKDAGIEIMGLMSKVEKKPSIQNSSIINYEVIVILPEA